jgi:4-hydroxy-tetrahydrodipicolinate synthase
MLERQKKQLNKLADKSNSRFEEMIVQTLYIIFFIAYNLFEVYLIYLIGKYSNKISELVLIVLCFFVNKAVYGKPLHFSNNFICLGVSLLLFYTATQCALNLDLSIIIELKKISNIVGVKESNKDIGHIMDIANICDDNFYLYCGNDELSYLFLTLGAKGIINVFGNIEPKVMKNLINIFNENEYLARIYFFQYYELFKALALDINPIPIKALMNYIGLNVGLYRLPLDLMDENNYNLLLDVYKITKQKSAPLI